MNEEELKEFLKKHLNFSVSEDPCSDGSYTTYTFQLLLDNEQIGDAQQIMLNN